MAPTWDADWEPAPDSPMAEWIRLDWYEAQEEWLAQHLASGGSVDDIELLHLDVEHPGMLRSAREGALRAIRDVREGLARGTYDAEAALARCRARAVERAATEIVNAAAISPGQYVPPTVLTLEDVNPSVAQLFVPEPFIFPRDGLAEPEILDEVEVSLRGRLVARGHGVVDLDITVDGPCRVTLADFDHNERCYAMRLMWRHAEVLGGVRAGWLTRYENIGWALTTAEAAEVEPPPYRDWPTERELFVVDTDAGPVVWFQRGSDPAEPDIYLLVDTDLRPCGVVLDTTAVISLAEADEEECRDETD